MVSHLESTTTTTYLFCSSEYFQDGLLGVQVKQEGEVAEDGRCVIL